MPALHSKQRVRQVLCLGIVQHHGVLGRYKRRREPRELAVNRAYGKNHRHARTHGLWTARSQHSAQQSFSSNLKPLRAGMLHS